ncbi:hypothetical protein NE237_012654 [Protea cynaroides]|uniref:Uncharacterized protein n=1 Tax=Protea cynaroides TaxID=273540 RepID=A0A9Q0GZI5_9MAGN|nr:hypothetical protein NE237_012654 [Protea cynaroides]
MAAPTTPTPTLVLEASSPYYLHPSDQPGHNHAIIIVLETKNKLDFVDDTIPKPKAPSTDLPCWIRCNSMVQSWLVHSTIPSIVNIISNYTQGTNAIATYYITLKGFWDELSSYHKLPTYSCGALKDLSTTIEIDHLMDFLQGLNESYSRVSQPNITHGTPTPS